MAWYLVKHRCNFIPLPLETWAHEYCGMYSNVKDNFQYRDFVNAVMNFQNMRIRNQISVKGTSCRIESDCSYVG